jgi:hypothetical protein
LDLLPQGRLIILDRQHVVAAALDDPAGDLPLAPDRIKGDHRTLEVHQIQQPGDGGDLVALVLYRHLGEGHAILALADQRADQVDRTAGVPSVQKTPANALAVNGHQPAPRRLHQRRHPGHEASLEGLGVQQREDAVEGVVRGNPVGQLQERRKPLGLGTPEQFHLTPALGPADHRHYRDHDHVRKHVNLIATTRVGQVLEKAHESPGRSDVHVKAPRVKKD